MNWIEISIIADGELTESIADVFARHVEQGVSIEATAIEIDPDDEGRPVGPLKVRAFFPNDDHAAETREKIERDLFYLNMIRPIPQPSYNTVADEDWANLWKANYHPMRVGQRLIIIPAWLNPPLQPNDIPLLMDPGMAFGTGTHPTTQLCLELIEAHLKPNDSILDVGCGSGILSIGALKLGASHAFGIDIDQAAIEATHENAQLNGVTAITAQLGSLKDLTQQRTQYDLTLANILARVIIKLLHEEGLAQTIQRHGILILSGILQEQANDVIAALAQHHLEVFDRRDSGDWVGLAARPQG